MSTRLQELNAGKGPLLRPSYTRRQIEASAVKIVCVSIEQLSNCSNSCSPVSSVHSRFLAFLFRLFSFGVAATVCLVERHKDVLVVLVFLRRQHTRQLFVQRQGG